MWANTIKNRKSIFIFNRLKKFVSYFHDLTIIREEERIVTPHCKLNVQCPYNVFVRPLDILLYPSNDKVKVVLKSEESVNNNMKFNIHDNEVIILDESKNLTEDMVCEIEIPGNATLRITTERDINVANFDTTIINLKSLKGNIRIDKCKGENTNITAVKGNIDCKEGLEGENINLKVSDVGTVSVEKINGGQLKIESNSGSVTVKNTNCKHNLFETIKGNFFLQNVFHQSKILIQKEGDLNILGVIGNLSAEVKKGNLNFQITEFSGNSRVVLEDRGNVDIKLSDNCQSTLIMEVLPKHFILSDGISLNLKYDQSRFVLVPKYLSKFGQYNSFVLNCKNSDVYLRGYGSVEDHATEIEINSNM